MKILSGIAVLAVLTAGAATPSFATLLPVNGTVPVPVTTFVGADFTSLGTTGSQAYSVTSTSGLDSGFIGASVGTYTLNPFGANDLTFVYQVFVSTGDVTRITNTNFSGFNLDVAQAPFGASTNAAETADLNTLGVVGFNFTPPLSNELTAGQETYLLIVNTNATNFTTGNISIIDGATATVAGFQPAATPEPSTLSLLGTGLLAVGAGLRRKMLKK